MLNYLAIAGIGVALVGIWALVSKFLLSDAPPDLRHLEGGVNFETMGAEDRATPVDNTALILVGVKKIISDRDKKAFRNSIWVSLTFYALGVITSTFGEVIASTVQAALM